MRDLLLIGGIGAAAIALGGILFFFGPSSLHSDIQTSLSSIQDRSSTVKFSVLAQGTNAISISDRTNYRILSQNDLEVLWTMIYGDRDRPNIPPIDFTKNEVLAIFDGTHTSGAYAVQAEVVVDKTPVRAVTIDHLVPGPSCSNLGAKSSPFELLLVPKTSFTLTHTDTTIVSTCAN